MGDNQSTKDIDLGGVELDSSGTPVTGKVERETDLHLHDTRRRIAYWILGLLSFVILAIILMVTFMVAFTDTSVALIKDIMMPLLTSIIGLVGSVIGFYYGSNLRD